VKQGIHVLRLLSFAVLVFGLAACGQLQRGYYLTPENYPGAEIAPPTATLPPILPPSADTTATPVSTVRAIPTETLTPLPAPTETAIPEPTRIACAETNGTIVFDSFISAYTGGTVNSRVYLPPCYSLSGKRFPVLIMLHGLGAGMDDSQWDEMGLDEAADAGFADGSLAPLIIVMPNGNDAGHESSYGDYPEVLVEELIPRIESLYCTLDHPSGWAIGGLSRGGFWATWIAFSWPDLFSRLGGHSPYFYEPESGAEKNPNNLVDGVHGINHLAIYFDHGKQDYPQVLEGVGEFVSRLRQQGIAVQYVINEQGDHTEAYWSEHTADYLEFYTAEWPRHLDDLSACDAEQ
jgi:enterochelin esterase-like enzyme